jgi:hypothetical protein
LVDYDISGLDLVGTGGRGSDKRELGQARSDGGGAFGRQVQSRFGHQGQPAVAADAAK